MRFITLAALALLTAAAHADDAPVHVTLSVQDNGAEKVIGEGDVAAPHQGSDLLLIKDGKTYVLHFGPPKASIAQVPASTPTPAPSAAAPPAPAPASGALALTPLTTKKIEVPDDACRQRLSGWVTLEFAVMPDGTVADAHVTQSEPKGVFDAAALAAVSGRTYPPQAKPVKAHERMPITFADCRVEQLRGAATAEGAPAEDCPALAQQALALGEQINADEAGRGLLEGAAAQIYSAPSDHCAVAGKKLKAAKLVSHVEYNGFSLVGKPKDKPEAFVWVRSNALKDLVP